jgi:dTDP-4-dehydrorhamnose 3,5-epimerase
MLYVPEGCGHGYLTLGPNTDLVYQASVPYASTSATGVRYDDPAFNILWPGAINLVSPQDQNWPNFSCSRSGGSA